jgi:hypothetical protein
MGKRQYAQKEWRLLSWWLATFHPEASISMNVRVGPTNPLVGLQTDSAVTQQLSRLRNRWIDAIMVENGAVSLIEAKIEPDPGIFSQLIDYLVRFRRDPNYSQYAQQPVNLVALVYNDDESVAAQAPWYGVTWTVFQPALDGILPPVLRGGPLADIASDLPQDWPARISWLTGRNVASFR